MRRNRTPGAVDAEAGVDAAQSGRTTHNQHSKQNNLAKAQQLGEAGIPLFPCKQDKSPRTPSGFKDASSDPTQIERWWSCDPEALIGVPTGSKSGLWVLDADVDKITGNPTGDTTLARYDLSQYRHRCRTPSGGSHYFFLVTPDLPRNSIKKIPGVDVRGDGGYVIAWDPDALLAAKQDSYLGPPPAALLEHLNRTTKKPRTRMRSVGADDANVRWAEATLERELERIRAAREGTRRDTLNAATFRMARILSAGSLSEPTIEAALIDAGLSTGLPEDEVRRTVQDALSDGGKIPPVEPPETSCADSGRGGPITEDAVALEFTRRFSREFRYVQDLSRWMVFSNGRWSSDDLGVVPERMRALARELANTVRDKQTSTRIAVGKRSFVRGVEQLARTDRAFSCMASDFDKDPWLLGTPTGVMDLRTGARRPAKAEDLISMTTMVDAADRSGCPHFKRFLEETTGDDAGLIRFIQQYCGYCLSGITSEHALVFIHGPGGNGKSVFLSVLTEIMGNYAQPASMDTFAASNFERHSTYLAMLRNVRLATASETERGRPWAESRIKQLTGGDPITARFMRQDFFTFIPKFKLMMVGNHEPVLQNVDAAMRRRLNIVPFTRTPDRPDKEMLQKLRGEYSAILRWMIEGCLDWQANRLIRPISVTQATNAYFENQDVFGQWLSDRCSLTPGDSSKSELVGDLYQDWSLYSSKAGEEPVSRKAFTGLLRQSGLESTKSTRGTRIVRFVTLKSGRLKSDRDRR